MPQAARASLAEAGASPSEVLARLEALRCDDTDWREGRVPLYVFDGGEEVSKLSHAAYSMFFSENGLGGGAFPSLRQMESVVTDYGLSLMNAPEGGKGTLTSGGTESIFLAVKTARDRAEDLRGIREGGEIVMSRTAHPAFDKAAHYLRLVPRRIDADSPGFTANVESMSAAISERTVLVIGSAPAFPHGAVDPIAELGALAEGCGVPLHVDACVGGFLLPFSDRTDLYDFRAPGVRSISADIHKYGYSAKGASLVLYSDGDYAAYQDFHFDDWDRGHYHTETFTGTRPAGAIASAYAVMTCLGREGYRRLTQRVIDTRRKIEAAIAEIDGLFVIGRPELSIIAYGAETYDINAVGDRMAERGWYVARTTRPKGLHLMLNAVHARGVDEYIADLREATAEVKRGGLRSSTTSEY